VVTYPFINFKVAVKSDWSVFDWTFSQI